jgi:hypothetical protein
MATTSLPAATSGASKPKRWGKGGAGRRLAILIIVG